MTSCKLCHQDGGLLIWTGAQCRVVQVEDPELPGYCRVIWHQHVAEMSLLAPGERDQLMRVVFGVEEIIFRTMSPGKINLAALGNQVPHLHWHVIPRYQDDVFFPDSIWSTKRREPNVARVRERQLLAEALPDLILAAVGDWSG